MTHTLYYVWIMDTYEWIRLTLELKIKIFDVQLKYPRVMSGSSKSRNAPDLSYY